ncbi:MAG: hypothetical protein P8180_10135 [Gammaproteobacteria bacterium]|jgi:hypothetical protein
MPGNPASPRQAGYLVAAGLVLGLLLPTAGATAGITGIETLPGPNARIDNVQVCAGEARTEVRGTVRLLPTPLAPPIVGRIVLEAVAGNRAITRREAVLYRVVTANRRARLFGFRATLPANMPAETQLRIYRLPPPK